MMEKLHTWLTAQFNERKVEPNSGLGTAISYLLKHWTDLLYFCGNREHRLITMSVRGR